MRQKHGNRSRDRTEAYSLPEILIVILLLSTLTAMLLPVFGTVRGQARTTSCLSNLRQIGAAVALYAQDNDGGYPWATDRSNQYSPGWSQMTPDESATVSAMPMLNDVLGHYVSDKSVWRCPSDTGLSVTRVVPPGDTTTLLKIGPSAFDQFGSSYAYVTDLGLDHVLYSASGFYARNGQEVSASSVRVVEDMSPLWHGNGAFALSCVFADGHAANLNGEQFQAVSGVVTSPPRPAGP